MGVQELFCLSGTRPFRISARVSLVILRQKYLLILQFKCNVVFQNTCQYLDNSLPVVDTLVVTGRLPATVINSCMNEIRNIFTPALSLIYDSNPLSVLLIVQKDLLSRFLDLTIMPASLIWLTVLSIGFVWFRWKHSSWLLFVFELH